MNAELADPLLACLKLAAEQYRTSFSAPAVTAGLPLEKGRLTPDLLERAGERAGLEVKSCELPSARDEIALPAIYVDAQRRCWVLVTRNVDKVVGMEPVSGESASIPVDELATAGNLLFAVRPKLAYDGRVTHLFRFGKAEWFWSTLLLQRADYVYVALGALFVNLFALSSPLFTMNVYDRVVSTRAEQTLAVLAIGMLLVIVFDFVMRQLRGRLVDAAGHRADLQLSQKLMEKVLSIRMLDKPASSGSFASQLGDFDHLRDFFTSAVITTLIDLPFLLLFLVVIGYIGGGLVFVPLACIPLSLFAGYLAHRKLAASIQESQAVSAQKNSLAVEVVSALETVKGVGAENAIQYRWERLAERASMLGMRQRDVSNNAMYVNMVLQQVASVGIVFFGASRIFEGEMTVGALIACTLLSSRALAPLAQVTGLLTRSARTLSSFKGLQELMNKPGESADNVRRLSRAQVSGALEMRGLCFSYPGQAQGALTDINLTIRPGERIGIIGKSGSGKSTMLKILLGFYEPQKGALLMDDVDASQIEMSDRRNAIGYVGQDSVLMFGSIHHNITIGAPLASDDELREAAQLAGIIELIRALPLGIASVIGERGEGISGGQKQLLLMARTLIRKSPILVLDEPTSAMDANTERMLINRMMEYVQGRTVVIATHKPPMLDLVDRLIVMDGGRVVADGPKDKVMEHLNAGIKLKRVGA